MLLPPNQRLRTLARASAADWVAACAAFEGGKPLKDHRRGTVWASDLLGRPCVLKCLRLDTPRRRAQSLLGRSPLWRHWRQARWLRAHGIATAETLVLVRGRRDGVPVECLVMERLPGATVLEHMAAPNLSTRQRHRIAQAVAGLACSLARQGRINRDAKPSNLIVTSVDEAGAELAVIDCADLRRCSRREPAVARMLASVMIEATGCGCPPSLAERARAVRAAAVMLSPADPRSVARRLWDQIDILVAAHGDPRPEVNPLA